MFRYSFLLKLTESETTNLQAIFPFGDISHERWHENKRRGVGGGCGSGNGLSPAPGSKLLARMFSCSLLRLALGMESLLTGYENKVNYHLVTPSHYRQPENMDGG